MFFRVIVKNLDGSKQHDLPFTSLSFSEELNNDRSATVTFERQILKQIADTYGVTPLSILTDEYKELYIYDVAGNLVYSGYISDIVMSRGKGEQGSMQIASKGFFSLLARRYTADLAEYISEDASNIAWGLIAYTQALTNGDFGITRGADPTTVDRDRTFRYKNIKDAIEGMSNTQVKNGYDFEIDNNKAFNVYFPNKGTQRPEIVLQDNVNIDTYSIRKPFLDSVTNEVIVFGDGIGEGGLVVVRDAEPVYQEVFNLLQSTLSEKDVIELTTLQDKGDKFLDNEKFPKLGINITADYDTIQYVNFGVGDWLKMIIPNEEIDASYRVIKRTVQNDGTVNITFEPK
jgi:hypothetical protein